MNSGIQNNQPVPKSNSLPTRPLLVELFPFDDSRMISKHLDSYMFLFSLDDNVTFSYFVLTPNKLSFLSLILNYKFLKVLHKPVSFLNFTIGFQKKKNRNSTPITMHTKQPVLTSETSRSRFCHFVLILLWNYLSLSYPPHLLGYNVTWLHPRGTQFETWRSLPSLWFIASLRVYACKTKCMIRFADKFVASTE